jgi:hypothetical protein
MGRIVSISCIALAIIHDKEMAMIKVLSKEVRKLIRENPKAVRTLLQSRLPEYPEDRIEVPSDDGTRMLVFRVVYPKE